VIVAVCVAKPRELAVGGKTKVTGIFKEPVTGPVAVGPEGLAGDHIADPRYHGGRDKAVYSYAEEHYAFWRPSLGPDLSAGAFGENLLTRGLDEDAVRAGDRWRAGTALLEAREARQPCSTLAARYRDPGLVKRFAAAGRFGIYWAVVEPGVVRPGDAMALETRGTGEGIAESARRKLSKSSKKA
jgi:MOSC domain-containing protein YiiM